MSSRKPPQGRFVTPIGLAITIIGLTMSVGYAAPPSANIIAAKNPEPDTHTKTSYPTMGLTAYTYYYDPVLKAEKGYATYRVGYRNLTPGKRNFVTLLNVEKFSTNHKTVTLNVKITATKRKTVTYTPRKMMCYNTGNIPASRNARITCPRYTTNPTKTKVTLVVNTPENTGKILVAIPSLTGKPTKSFKRINATALRKGENVRAVTAVAFIP